MKHTKIYPLSDGSKLKIIVYLRTDVSRDSYSWIFDLSSCEKGKRTWTSSVDTNTFWFKTQTLEDRALFIKSEIFRIAGEERLQEVADELVNILKFKSHDFLKE
jgi:hypothetical protein